MTLPVPPGSRTHSAQGETRNGERRSGMLAKDAVRPGSWASGHTTRPAPDALRPGSRAVTEKPVGGLAEDAAGPWCYPWEAATWKKWRGTQSVPRGTALQR